MSIVKELRVTQRFVPQVKYAMGITNDFGRQMRNNEIMMIVDTSFITHLEKRV